MFDTEYVSKCLILLQKLKAIEVEFVKNNNTPVVITGRYMADLSVIQLLTLEEPNIKFYRCVKSRRSVSPFTHQ